VSADVVLAGFAGALAVAGTWEAVAAIEQASAARAIGRVLGPLRSAGADGREPSSAERRRLAVVGAATLLGAGWLIGGPVAGGALATAGPWVVRRRVLARRRRWRADVARAAPAAARALADALAGGSAVRGAVAVAARDGGVPGAGGAELRAAARALALGDRTDDVLERLRRRAADPAWDAIVAAVLLQRDAGGDLARLLRTIAGRLEEGARAEADARSATAQARFTAWLVTLLPAGAAVLAELGQPGYLGSLLRAPATASMLVGAAALEVVAIVAIRRIARVGGP
jgi:tight adherence protein B